MMYKWIPIILVGVGFGVAVAGVAMLSVPISVIVFGVSLTALGLLYDFDQDM